MTLSKLAESSPCDRMNVGECKYIPHRVVSSCRYEVDTKFAGVNHWGFQAGCKFAESSTSAIMASSNPRLTRFTCRKDDAPKSEPEAMQCTPYLTSRGFCTAGKNYDGLLHVQARIPLLFALIALSFCTALVSEACIVSTS
jgi:hypothetical protein